MIRIRSGRGVGDSLYLRPIVEYLVAQGEHVIALSDYPEIFIGSGADVAPFTRSAGNTRVAHYVRTMADQSVTQYRAMLRDVGIDADVPLRFKWTVRNRALIDRLHGDAAERPIILVHGGREPMQRGDSWGRDLMPTHEAFEAALSALDDCYTVRVGKAPHLYQLPVSEDLNGETSIADLLDIATICDGVVAQCSFAVPLAEVFDRPLLAIWAAKGLKARDPHIRSITFDKVIEKPKQARLIRDDWHANIVHEEARRWLKNQVRSEACTAS